ncbi:hypothetical protein [Streptomyces sp. 35G-GA-8]|uniref:hypothetical protein n=1 Tax=Streptomyces sp. 35G-GA-8 TaxID=2939434 RepID=UPI00201F052D|nr:hypothetical protein [Streptomyces sp. 35G-GA-8]MCL7377794.1 hypothetical protein [Streptomyces sp. 35G-GA-8]
MQSPRGIDEVLEDAVIPDAFAEYDLAASKAQIARDVADTLMFDGSVARNAGVARTRPAAPADFFPTVHDQAGKDLHALSAEALHGIDAAGRLARLANSRRIDPDGALYFACLLNLAGWHEGAQFWWQFAAGAGNPTAAYCLYLLHLGRGERRDAAHWADQAADLDSGLVALPAGRLTVSRPTTHHRRPPSPALRAAVQRLTIEEDEEFGSVPHPDPHLAEQIGELADAL